MKSLTRFASCWLFAALLAAPMLAAWGAPEMAEGEIPAAVASDELSDASAGNAEIRDAGPDVSGDGAPDAADPDAANPEAADPDSDAPDADDPDSDAPALPETPCPLKPGLYSIGATIGWRLVLDVEGASISNGANVELWSSNDGAHQRFRLNVDSDGLCTIIAEHAGKALTVAFGSDSVAPNVEIRTFVGSDAQRWKILETEDGAYLLESVAAPGHVLDIAGASDQPGANLQLYPRNGSVAQRFNFYPADAEVAPGEAIEEGIYELHSALGPGIVLDIAGGSLSNGAAAQIYASNGTLAQYFTVRKSSEGFYTIQSVGSGKYLDVSNGTIVPPASVVQWDRSGENQEWSFHTEPDGAFQLICRANGLALDVYGAQTAPGSTVDAFTPNGTAAQHWRLRPVERLFGDGGVYRIACLFKSDQVLDVAGASTAEGTNVQGWMWNGTLAQRWSLRSVGDVDGAYTIESLLTGMVLTREGDNVVQRPARNGRNQQWVAAAAPTGGVSFTSVDEPSLALDVSGAGGYDGVNIGVYRQNSTAAQAFVPIGERPLGSGIYVIGFVSSGRAVDVAGASFDGGANVQAYSFNDSGAQKWIITDQGGDYTIVNARSGCALDVTDGWAAPGANVRQWPQNGAAAQRWSIVYRGGGAFQVLSALGDYLALSAQNDASFDGANVFIDRNTGTGAELFRFLPTTYQVTTAELYDRILGAPGGGGLSTFGGSVTIGGDQWARLQDAANRIRSSGFRLGFLVIDMDTGKGFGSGIDDVIYSASSIKGPYVAAVCRYNPWSVGTWRSTMDETIVYSSNEGYAALRKAFGSWPMERLMMEARVNTVPAYRNYVWYSTRDFARLWVAAGSYLLSDEMNADYCRGIFSRTTHSSIHNELSRGGTVTYSKPGWYPPMQNYAAFNDGGIVVRGGQRYLIAMLTTAYERFDLTQPLIAAIDAAAWGLR